MINHEEIRKALENEQKFVLVEEYRRWLRSLLEEVERMKADFEAAEIVIKAERQENERITKERDELGEIVRAAVIPCHVCMKNGCDCNVTYFSDFATGEMVAKQYNELQQLREELEHLKKENEKKFIMNSDMVSSYENELSRLRSELEQVKKEQDLFRGNFRESMVERDEIIKTLWEALEWIADEDNAFENLPLKARCVLSHYKGLPKAIEPNEQPSP